MGIYNTPGGTTAKKETISYKVGLLDAEEALLPAGAAGEAAVTPVRRQPPVARDYDRDRVGPAGGADGPRCARLGQTPGDLAVRAGLAKRDLEELPPNGLLEIGAARQIERRQFFWRLTKQQRLERGGGGRQPTLGQAGR